MAGCLILLQYYAGDYGGGGLEPESRQSALCRLTAAAHYWHTARCRRSATGTRRGAGGPLQPHGGGGAPVATVGDGLCCLSIENLDVTDYNSATDYCQSV